MPEGRIRRSPAIDVGHEVAAMRRSVIGSGSDLLMRHALVCSASVALWIASGRISLLAWGLGYSAVGLLYARALAGTVAPPGFGRYLRLLFVHAALALTMTGMIWWVLTWHGAVSIFVAACGIGALALHTLIRHDRWSQAAVVDVGNVVLAALGMIAIVASRGLDPADAAAVAIIGAGVMGYFLHSVGDIIDTRTRLAARHAAEAQAEKMQAIGQLGAGIAHDFNNILTVIRGNLDLIDVEEDAHARAEVLNEARKGTDRAAHLVRQLLAYSRKSQLSVTRFCLHEFLAETAAVLRRVLPETIKVRLAPARAEVILAADRALLSTAILNAALNARDAMSADGGELTILVREQGGMVALVLRDTGPGVAPEILARVAEPFFTTKPPGQGSGLGLSMIKGFAEQSGGELRLANLLGGGFSVEIRLPVQDLAESAGAGASRAVAS